jgi:uncharacterized protein YkwD
MGTILVVAATWLFLLVLAVSIFRTAALADRAAERRLREPRPSRPVADVRRRAARTVLMVAALPLAGTAVGVQDADAQTCKTARSGARLSAPSATLCLVNRERHAHGLAPLVGNARLSRAAGRHAADMVRRGYFAHVSPDGTGFSTRLLHAGYARGCTSWAGGETLAWGSGTQSSPASRVSAWMHSPPHRAILLGATYREAGIAVVKGTPGAGPNGLTYVGEFGRRRC